MTHSLGGSGAIPTTGQDLTGSRPRIQDPAQLRPTRSRAAPSHLFRAEPGTAPRRPWRARSPGGHLSAVAGARRGTSPTIVLDIRSVVLYRVNMARSRHPKKDVENALHDAESAGWTVAPTQSGHRWGVMRCGAAGDTSECRASIWSTPRNPGDHAKQLRRFIARCPHRGV